MGTTVYTKKDLEKEARYAANTAAKEKGRRRIGPVEWVLHVGTNPCLAVTYYTTGTTPMAHYTNIAI